MPMWLVGGLVTATRWAWRLQAHAPGPGGGPAFFLHSPADQLQMLKHPGGTFLAVSMQAFIAAHWAPEFVEWLENLKILVPNLPLSLHSNREALRAMVRASSLDPAYVQREVAEAALVQPVAPDGTRGRRAWPPGVLTRGWFIVDGRFAELTLAERVLPQPLLRTHIRAGHVKGHDAGEAIDITSELVAGARMEAMLALDGVLDVDTALITVALVWTQWTQQVSMQRSSTHELWAWDPTPSLRVVEDGSVWAPRDPAAPVWKNPRHYDVDVSDLVGPAVPIGTIPPSGEEPILPIGAIVFFEGKWTWIVAFDPATHAPILAGVATAVSADAFFLAPPADLSPLAPAIQRWRARPAPGKPYDYTHGRFWDARPTEALEVSVFLERITTCDADECKHVLERIGYGGVLATCQSVGALNVDIARAGAAGADDPTMLELYKQLQTLEAQIPAAEMLAREQEADTKESVWCVAEAGTTPYDIVAKTYEPVPGTYGLYKQMLINAAATDDLLLPVSKRMWERGIVAFGARMEAMGECAVRILNHPASEARAWKATHIDRLFAPVPRGVHPMSTRPFFPTFVERCSHWTPNPADVARVGAAHVQHDAGVARVGTVAPTRVDAPECLAWFAAAAR